MQPLTLKALKITGRIGKSGTSRFKHPILTGRTGVAKPPTIPEGGFGGGSRTIWGHAAVEGRLNAGSLLEFGAKTIFGALQAAAKRGGRGDVLEVMAKSVAQSLVSAFERELKRATIAAYQEGYRAGMAEGIARERAAQRAAEGAATIFPQAEHYLRKRDQASGMALATSLQEYHGTKTADLLDLRDIPPQPVTSISGWVQAAGLVGGQLAIQFRGGKAGPVVCIYQGSGYGALEDLLAASSAGKWVHSHVYGAQYMQGGFSR